MLHLGKVSIIVPIYNAEKTISRCVESILSQTYSDFELILVDDGSSDYSLDICNNYEQQDSRVKVFTQKNAGPSSARNTGLKESTGKWISFVDSDDWIDGNHIEELLSATTEETGMAVCGYILENSVINKPIAFRPEKITGLKSIADFLIGKMCYQYGLVWNKIFRGDVIRLNKIQFPEGILLGEDVYFVTQYLCHIDSIIITDKISYHYLYQEGVHLSGIILKPDELQRQLSIQASSFEGLYKQSKSEEVRSLASRMFYNHLFYDYVIQNSGKAFPTTIIAQLRRDSLADSKIATYKHPDISWAVRMFFVGVEYNSRILQLFAVNTILIGHKAKVLIRTLRKMFSNGIFTNRVVSKLNRP